MRVNQISVENDDREDWRVKDIRFKIGKKVGTRQSPNSSLHVNTLNSAYAYLQGEFYTKPAHLNSHMSPGPKEMRRNLAIVVENRDYDLGEYVPGPDDISEGEEWSGRPFRRSELITILDCLYGSEDQREWTP